MVFVPEINLFVFRLICMFLDVQDILQLFYFSFFISCVHTSHECYVL